MGKWTMLHNSVITTPQKHHWELALFICQEGRENNNNIAMYVASELLIWNKNEWQGISSGAVKPGSMADFACKVIPWVVSFIGFRNFWPEKKIRLRKMSEWGLNICIWRQIQAAPFITKPQPSERAWQKNHTPMSWGHAPVGDHVISAETASGGAPALKATQHSMSLRIRKDT